MSDSRLEESGGPAYRPEFLTSAELVRTEYHREWLVEGILVGDQPGVIGGEAKAMKSSVAFDLAISLGSGTTVLGCFVAPRQARVAILAGESGTATTKETASRDRELECVDLNDHDTYESFRLPRHLDFRRSCW